MPTNEWFLPAVPIDTLKVLVLAPSLTTSDDHIDYYYDFSQCIAEYTKVFDELQINWQWQPVTIFDYQEVIEKMLVEKTSGIHFPVILNLCDGDEINKISVQDVLNCF